MLLVIVAAVSSGLALMWFNREPTPPPVFDLNPEDFKENGSLRKGAVPRGQEILRALRSDDKESASSAMYLLIEVLNADNPKELWPAGLPRVKVYKYVEKYLDSENEVLLKYALSLADPARDFGKGFYRNKKHVEEVQEAIERWNKIQRKEKTKKAPTRIWFFYELILDEDGNPVKYEIDGGAIVQ